MFNMDKPIAIILGAGENIGAATSKAFAAKGYRVALVSRTIDTSDTNEARISITADLSKIGTVSSVFSRVREVWGEPSLIFYNAAAVHRTDPTNPFTISEEDFAADLAVNTTSVYAAMKEAVASFQILPDDAAKTFFYTGNALASPGLILPRAFSLGAGKSATAHLVHVGSQAYKEAGFKFYLVDQRSEDGGPMKSRAGAEAHAEFLSNLLESNAGEVPWYASFVEGKGYVKC